MSDKIYEIVEKAYVVLLAVLFSSTLMMIAFHFIHEAKIDYKAEAVVVETCGNDITIKTPDGNLWTYVKEKGEQWYINEPVIISFDDNKTPDNIYDDIVIKLEEK